jgi:hypothetical protein
VYGYRGSEPLLCYSLSSYTTATFVATSAGRLYLWPATDTPCNFEGGLAPGDGGSMLLVEPDQVPGDMRDELRRLAPDEVVIVGGTEAVSLTVERTL